MLNPLLFIYETLFFAIPVAAIVLFGISLNRYISAKIHNNRVPGTWSDEEIKKRKTFLVVTSVVMGVLGIIVLGFIILLFGSLAHM